MTYRGSTTYPLAKMKRQVQHQPQAQPRLRSAVPRLARAFGVERRALGHALNRARHDLTALRKLTLADLSTPPLRTGDAERIFYLVQWERLQAHLETHGKLPEPAELAPLLETLTPIFERHFSHTAPLSRRLNETLLTLHRAELGLYAISQPGLTARFPKRSLPYFLQRFMFRPSLTWRLNTSSLNLSSRLGRY